MTDDVHVEPVRRRDRADHRVRRRDPRRSSRTPRSRRCCRRSRTLTGDLSLLRDDLRPDPLLVGDAAGRADRRAAGRGARSSRSTRSIRFRDGGCQPAPPPVRRASCSQIMEYAVGGAEMARVPPAARGGARVPGRGPAGAGLAQGRHRARTSTSASSIIGAGHVGPARRAPAAAGRRAVRRSSRRTTTSAARGSRTRYPGCRVDNPNHNYSYSFAQRHDWPLHFSTQDVLLDYFRRCADAFGLREHIRFGTEVAVGRRGPTTTLRWTVRVRTADGARGDARRPTR